MNNILKLHEAGFVIQRVGIVGGDYGFAEYDAFCLMGEGDKPCGLLRVALSADLYGWEGGHDALMNMLYIDANEQDEDCVNVANAMRKEVETLGFFYTLTDCSHWTHLDYCFIEEEYRGEGLGALFVLAWIEMYASNHFVTAIPELAQPHLVKYWHERAGFKPISASSQSGPVYRVSSDDDRVLPHYVDMINHRLTSHKEAIREEAEKDEE